MKNNILFLTLVLLTSFATTYSSEDVLTPSECRTAWKQAALGESMEEVPLLIFGIPLGHDVQEISPVPFFNHVKLLQEQVSNPTKTPEQRYDYQRAAVKQAKVALDIAMQNPRADLGFIQEVADFLGTMGTSRSNFYAAKALLVSMTSPNSTIPAEQATRLAFKALKSAPPVHETKETYLTQRRIFNSLEFLCSRLAVIAHEKNTSLDPNIYWFLGRCSQEGWGCIPRADVAMYNYAQILGEKDTGPNPHPLKESAKKQLAKIAKKTTDSIATQIIGLASADLKTIVSTLETLDTTIDGDNPDLALAIVNAFNTQLRGLALQQKGPERSKILCALGKAQFLSAARCPSDAVNLGIIDQLKKAAVLLKLSGDKNANNLLAKTYHQMADAYRRLPDEQKKKLTIPALQMEHLNKAVDCNDREVSFNVARDLFYSNRHQLTPDAFVLFCRALKASADAEYPKALGLMAHVTYWGEKLPALGNNLGITQDKVHAYFSAKLAKDSDDLAALIYAHLSREGLKDTDGKVLLVASYQETIAQIEAIVARSEDPNLLSECGAFCALYGFKKQAFEAYSKNPNYLSHGGLALLYGEGCTPDSKFKISDDYIDHEKCVLSLLAHINGLQPIEIKALHVYKRGELRAEFNNKVQATLRALATQVTKGKITAEQQQEYANQIREKLAQKALGTIKEIKS